jgi:hypothetical protein
MTKRLCPICSDWTRNKVNFTGHMCDMCMFGPDGDTGFKD